MLDVDIPVHAAHAAIALGMGGLTEAYLEPDPAHPGQSRINPIENVFSSQKFSQTIPQALDVQKAYQTRRNNSDSTLTGSACN